MKKCPECKSEMQKTIFDIGYGINVESLHCKECGFNITEDNKLQKATALLKEQMTKEVKIIRVGTGLGVRFPNEIVRSFNLKRGEEMRVKPESNGVRLVMSER